MIDDWGLVPLSPEARRDLLEVLDDRHQRQSTIVTSQLSVAHWHEYLGDPTLADAILDRLVHTSYRLNLTGESLRKRAAERLTPGAPSAYQSTTVTPLTGWPTSVGMGGRHQFGIGGRFRRDTQGAPSG